jgi:methylmalonyl-CoA mutase N-terminal domain/subunit
VPPILDAVEAYVTVGEIADELRRAFGEYVEASAL